MEDYLQGAGLAERWDSSLPHPLPVVWILVVMAGTPTVIVNNHVTLEMDSIQALACPPPALFQSERKIKFILLRLWLF